MSYKTKTAEKKAGIMKWHRQGLPDTAIAEKFGLDRHTVGKVTREPEETKQPGRAPPASSGIERALAVEEEIIDHVAQLAHDKRFFPLLKGKFEEAGIAPVDSNFKDTQRAVGELKKAGWSDSAISFGASWLCSMVSSPVFRNLRNSSGNVDDGRLREFFSGVREIRDFCLTNGIGLDSFMGAVSELIHLNQRGVSAEDVVNVNTLLRQARLMNVKPEQMIGEYKTLLNRRNELSAIEEKLADGRAALSGVESELTVLRNRRQKLYEEAIEKAIELEHLNGAINVAAREILNVLKTSESVRFKLVKAGDEKSIALAGRLGVSASEAARLLNRKERSAIMHERSEENMRIIDYALTAEFSELFAGSLMNVLKPSY